MLSHGLLRLSRLEYAATGMALRVRLVAVVLFTDIFRDLPLGTRAVKPRNCKRLCVGLRVGQRDPVFQSRRVLAVQPLSDPQRIAVGHAGEIELRVATNVDGV